MISILVVKAIFSTVLGTGLMAILYSSMFISILAVLDFAPMRSMRNLLLWQGDPDKRYLSLLCLALLSPLSGGPILYIVAYKFVRVTWLNGYKRSAGIFATAFICIEMLSLLFVSGFSVIGIQILSELGIMPIYIFLLSLAVYLLDLFVFGIATNWNFNLRQAIANESDDDKRYLILLLIVQMLLWDVDNGMVLLFMLFAFWRAMYKCGFKWSLAMHIILSIFILFGTTRLLFSIVFKEEMKAKLLQRAEYYLREELGEEAQEPKVEEAET